MRAVYVMVSKLLSETWEITFFGLLFVIGRLKSVLHLLHVRVLSRFSCDKGDCPLFEDIVE